jgi:hypothetical protein
MSISKQGIITTSDFSEIPTNLYDKTIYTEPDGSTWIRIIHHNNPTSYKFASTNDFNNFVYIDENRWFFASLCDFVANSRWEFMIKQKTTTSATETKWRWIQYKNPYEATFNDTKAANITKNTSSGYSNNTNYGGVYKSTGSYTFLNCNNGSSGSWWGALGCWTAYQGGIPGYNAEIVSTGYIDLYLRIGSTVSIYENGVSANEFIEI